MALKIDEIMDLSLDDYIAILKNSANDDNVRGNCHDNFAINESKDFKFGRRKGNIDDENEDDDSDFLMQPTKELTVNSDSKEQKSDIWKAPDSSICYLDCNDDRNDLREKLNNSNNKTSVTKFSSVQYRMKAPNTPADRPRGIPTVLPLNAPVNSRNKTQSNRNRRKGGNRDYHVYNNFQRNFNNQKNNVFNTQPIFGGCGVPYGRVQKNRKPDVERKNFRFSVDRNDSSNNLNNSSNTSQNMIIQKPSSCINLSNSPPLNSLFRTSQDVTTRHYNNGFQSFPFGNLTPQAEAVLNLNSTGVYTTSSVAGQSNESLKSLLGFQGNVSSEMMPVFASRLMDFIQNGLQNPAVHKPVYDMKIQKDIHEIQRKPLLYKCPGGEVVSSDGAGVNCKIIPRTSGVSLNCRFA